MKITITETCRVEVDARYRVALELISQAQELKRKGYSNAAIAQRMGISESTVRNLLKGMV